MIKINGVELQDIDLMDADEAKRVEDAIKIVQESSKEAENIKVYSEMLTHECDVVYECFDTIFGEGTGTELFDDKKNLRVCINSFMELVDIVNSKQSEVEKEFSKYSPNRANRRK